MTADTELAAALALVDATVHATSIGPLAAIAAVARTALELDAEPSPKRGDRQAYRRLDRLVDEHAAAIADLVRLATGAQGGAA